LEALHTFELEVLKQKAEFEAEVEKLNDEKDKLHREKVLLTEELNRRNRQKRTERKEVQWITQDQPVTRAVRIEVTPPRARPRSESCDSRESELHRNTNLHFPAFMFAGDRGHVAISELQNWTMFCTKSLSDSFELEDFNPPDPRARNALLIGVRKCGEDTLVIAALGQCSVITKKSDELQKRYHNGLYWFCCNDGFGFSQCACTCLPVHQQQCWFLCKQCGHRGLLVDWGHWDSMSMYDLCIFSRHARLEGLNWRW